jgi:hypothetical protein
MTALSEYAHRIALRVDEISANACAGYHLNGDFPALVFWHGNERVPTRTGTSL